MTLLELAQKLRPYIEKAAQSLTDDDALDAASLFPTWKPDTDYTAGTRLRFGGLLYTVLMAHRSQETWLPGTAPSLYAKVLIPCPDVIPDWERPDSTNAYMKGDKVRFHGKVYESLMDYNAYSPEEYPAGWAERA